MTDGEIALEQFIHLPQCFQKLSAADVSESVYMRQWCSCSATLLKVVGSILGRGHTKDLNKMLVMTLLLRAHGCGVSITTDWLVSG